LLRPRSITNTTELLVELIRTMNIHWKVELFFVSKDSLWIEPCGMLFLGGGWFFVLPLSSTVSCMTRKLLCIQKSDWLQATLLYSNWLNQSKFGHSTKVPKGDFCPIRTLKRHFKMLFKCYQLKKTVKRNIKKIIWKELFYK
jgi:hypothetical protein